MADFARTRIQFSALFASLDVKSLHQMTGFTPIPEVTESPLHLSVIAELKPHSSSFISLWQMTFFLPLLCTRDMETEITVCF